MKAPHSFTVPGETLRKSSRGFFMLIAPWAGWSYRCDFCGTGLFLPTRPSPVFPIPACDCGAAPASWYPVALVVAPVTPPEQRYRGPASGPFSVRVPVTRALYVMDDVIPRHGGHMEPGTSAEIEDEDGASLIAFGEWERVATESDRGAAAGC